MSDKSGKRERRARRWIVAMTVLLAGLVALVPLFLTTFIVRVVLRQVFPTNTPELREAVLNLSGTLTVRDLSLHDRGASGHSLVTVREVEAEFNWIELLFRKIRCIRVYDLNLYEPSSGWSQISLPDLILEVLARPAGGAPALWVGILDVRGTIRSQPVKGPVLSNTLTLLLIMSGDRANPSRRLSVAVGDTRQLPEKMPEKPSIAVSVSVPATNTAFGLRADIESLPAAAGTRVLVKRLAIRQAAFAIKTDALRRYLPRSPLESGGRIETQLASLWAAGEFNPQAAQPNGKRISGSLAFSGLRVHVLSGPQTMLNLDDASGATRFDTALVPNRGSAVAVQWLTVTGAKARVGADTLRHYWVALASEIQGAVEVGLRSLQVSGELKPQGLAKGQRLAGRLDFAGVSLHVPGRSPLMLSLDDLSGASKIDTVVAPEPRVAITVERLHIANTKGSIDADTLRRRAANLPPAWHGPIQAALGTMDVSGQIAAGRGAPIGFSGNVRLQELSVHSPAGGEPVFALDSLRAAGNVESRLDRRSAVLSVRDGVMGWADLVYGNNVLNNLDANGSVDGPILTAQRCAAELFGGKISGELVFDLATRTMPRCEFQIKSINMHQALANISPKNIDAEGFASGLLHLVASAEGEPSGYVDLTFDRPGILKIGEVEEVKRMLAGNFGLNLAGMAMHDLSHYPFKEGRLRLESQGPNSELKARFVRQPRAAAEVTQPHKEIINGQEVWVGSLVVPVVDLTIPITGKSLGEILSMASGIHPVIESVSDQHGQ